MMGTSGSLEVGDGDSHEMAVPASERVGRGVAVSTVLLSFGLLVLLLAVGLAAAFLSGWASILD